MPLLAVKRIDLFERGQEQRRSLLLDCRRFPARKNYWQSGGIEAMASSEPQARFFFAGVSPGRA